MDRSGRARLSRSDVIRAVMALLLSSVGLALAAWILPGLGFDGVWPVVLVALVMAVVGLVIRPVLVAIATPLGMVGALVLALVGQAIVAYIALSVVPGVQLDSFLDAFWATWIVAGVATLGAWVMTAGTNDVVFAPLVRGATAREARRGPRRDRHPVRAARRGALPGAAVGSHGRDPADAVAVDPQRQPRVHGVDSHAARDDPGQPDGDPARDDRRHPGLPLGRPGHRAGLRGQQAGGCGRHRGPALRRERASGRRRGVGEQPVQRRRPHDVRDDEPDGRPAGRP